MHYSHGAVHNPQSLFDDNVDNVGGADARGGPDPLTPTPGTHRLWTQPPQSQLYTHNYYK